MATSKIAASPSANRLLASKRKALAELDDEFFGEIIGVAQAIDALRKALSEISTALDACEFEKASAIGYGKVAAEFIFLQRMLEGLQGACLQKEKLVADLASTLRRPYEDVLPKVDARMRAARPLDRKQRSANRRKSPKIRAKVEVLIARLGKEPKPKRSKARRTSKRA